MRLILPFTLLSTLACAQPVLRATFEPNRGQVAPAVEWVVRSGAGAPMYLRANGAAMATSATKSAPHVILRFDGANEAAESVGEEPLPSYSNYYLGRDEKSWFTGVPHFARVRYREVYPGIDVVYHANGRNVEYDFDVKPGADASRVHISFDHIESLRTGTAGELILTSGGGELRMRRPRVLQDGVEIASAYRIAGDRRVEFALARYDRRRALRIDPTVVFSSYLGGPGSESVGGIRVDSQGYLYIGGSSQSQVAPTLNPFTQPSLIVSSPYIFKFTGDGSQLVFYITMAVDNLTTGGGLAVDAPGSLYLTGITEALQLPLKNAIDSQFQAQRQTAYATKWAPDGRTLVYSTYFGGSGNENVAFGSDVDAAGNLYFSGTTTSLDLPVHNALQPAHGGGTVNGSPLGFVGPLDFYVTKLAPDGHLVFSTYLGGSGDDNCTAMALSPDGSIVLVGYTNRADFPLVNAAQTFMLQRTSDFFYSPVVVRMQGDGQALIFSTYYGGMAQATAEAVSVDAAGSIYLSGYAFPDLVTKNAFQSTSPVLAGYVAKIDASGQNTFYSTYLSNDQVYAYTQPYAIATARDGSVYVAGVTQDANFPLVNPLAGYKGNNEFFLTRVAPSGSSLMFSTFLGGSGPDSIPLLTLAPDGSLYFAGNTQSANLPTQHAFQPVFGGGRDIFFAKITDNSVVPVSPFTVSSGALAFRYVQGGPPASPQTITIQGSAYTAMTDSAWLSARPSLTDATMLAIAVDGSSLAPGQYYGSVVIVESAGDIEKIGGGGRHDDRGGSGGPRGSDLTIQIALTVLAPAPKLNSVTPNTIAVGSGDTQLTLAGNGFTSTATVLLNGISWPGTTTIVDSPQSVRITVPKLFLKNPGGFFVSVQNPQSAASSALLVSVQ